MTVLEKIKRCVSLVWDFQEIYGEEDIEEFCHNELSTYPQHNEIVEYFKHIENLEKENTELEKACDETQELLDKQIEATYKLDKENAELIQENEEMKKGLGCETCQIHLEYMRLNNKIAYLEKENAELKKSCDETQELLDKQIEATYKLDRENAELKEKLKPENCLKLLAKEGYIKFTGEQLTKAKNIIRYIIDMAQCWDIETGNKQHWKIEEAKKFLKDN